MNGIAKVERQKLLEEIYAMSDDKLIDFVQGLRSRISAAEKERDDLKKGKCFSLTFDEFNKMVAQCEDLAKERVEALAWGEKLKSYIQQRGWEFENIEAPAALSHLRQQVRREIEQELSNGAS